MGRTDPKLSQRMTYRLEAGGNRIVSKGEMSCDGGGWGGGPFDDVRVGVKRRVALSASRTATRPTPDLPRPNHSS
jgi:hypothetical protein